MQIANIYIAFLVLIISFTVLARAADWLVEGAVGLSCILRLPKILIGIIVVGVATTAPELMVSATSAFLGKPEIALGNAIGSVICDDGLALSLAVLISLSPILVTRNIFKITAVFLIVVDLVAYALCWDGTLDRGEGMLLVGLFAVYAIVMIFIKKHKDEEVVSYEKEVANSKIFLMFCFGLIGIFVASRFIVSSAVFIADYFNVPEAIIALGMVAFGTSIPEVATCITAARKGEGGIAVGNILGADILNVCWVAGVSAIVNPLTVGTKLIHFMFPAMLIMVFVMLGLMRINYRLERWKGGLLLGMYILYLFLLAIR
ncbi:MAG: calcium/sodium antiporter [Syntrophales bacterium]|nr:calcium/sodium antiporter [Syntrophales bacterium]